MTPRTLAVVTGGAGGMGLATALRLGREHRVLVAEPSADRLGPALDVLRGEGIDADGVACDVALPEAVSALAAEAEQRGSLAALVHAAGLSRSMADGPEIMRVNLVGTALVLDAFLPLAGPGSVAVCIASNGGHRAGVREYDEILCDPSRPGFLDAVRRHIDLRGHPQAAYDLSKRGVIRMVEERAAAWGERGARLLSVSPGLIETAMGRLEIETGGNDVVLQMTALKRLGTADDIAAVVEFLCSAGAAYVTGCDLVVDGGMLAGFNHHAPAGMRRAYNRLRVGDAGRVDSRPTDR